MTGNMAGPWSRISRAFVSWMSHRIDARLCRNGGYWLFILGVNNSGTTVLCKILEAHPMILGLPAEGQHLTNAFPRPDLHGVGRLWSSRMDLFRWTEGDDPSPALRAKKDWASQYPNRPGILLEKSPPNTVRSLWLQKNFRPSRFLAIVRNPYAVCEGIRRRRNYTIHQAACHWVSANAYMLHDMDFLENSMLVRYEDLTELTDDCLVSIQHFLGLETPFDRLACDSVSAHSLDGDTFGLRNLNEKSIVHLSACDIQEINNICGDMMRRFGYVMR